MTSLSTRPDPRSSCSTDEARPSVRVLIVDDSRAMRETVALLLEPMPVTVVGKAGDGNEALGMCRELQPDLVFLDVVMPGMSGIEVLERIKAILPEVTIVMLTSMSERNTVVRSKQLGACDYILKPVAADDLKSKVDRVVGKLRKDGP